ncbi:MAG: response regulator transcription factor [Proteobacteria bacterium]|nr:response regulator transcription factor [Pseudomonadota bacterium]
MITPTRNILVVEDDEMVQAFVDLHLGSEDYTVQTAANGAEMFVVLANAQPDLIVLDINLPDGDGLELLEFIRERSTVPIIIATARKDKKDRLTALRLGADDFIAKPFDPKELALRVRNVLKRGLNAAAQPNIRRNNFKAEWGNPN